MLSWLELCEQFAQRRPLTFALFAVSLLFALALTFFTPVFETNDDVIISMIASGTGIGIAPDEHLIFPNVAIGWVLKKLYTVAPDVPWYGVYLLGVHFAAYAALLYSILVWRYARIHAILFYVCFATVGIHLLLNLQYTSTAFLVVESGVILALTALCRRVEHPEWQPRRMLVAAGALIVLGSLVRWQSFLGAAAVAAPAVPIVLWRIGRGSPAGGKFVRPALLTAALTLAAIGGFKLLNAQYYQRDPAWREYLEFNTLRLHFNDFQWTRYTPETRPVFDQLPWSENDHAMIANWFFDDPRTYSLENLRKVVTGFPWGEQEVGWRDIRDRWAPIAADRSVWTLGMLLPLFVWTARNRRLAFALLAPATIAAVGLLLCLTFTKTPPSRVYYPALAFPFLLTLLLVRLGPERRARGQLVIQAAVIRIRGERRSVVTGSFDLVTLLHFAAILAALIPVSAGLYREYRHARTACKENEKLRAALAAIRPRDDQLFVIWSSCFPFEAILPLESPALLRETHLLSLGWPQQSPINQAMKARFGIDDLPHALYANPNLELVSVDWLNDIFATYVQEHHHARLDWETHFRNPQFSVWKPRPLSDSNSPGATLSARKN